MKEKWEESSCCYGDDNILELHHAIDEISVDNSCGSNDESECENDLEVDIDTHESHVKSLKERVQKEFFHSLKI